MMQARLGLARWLRGHRPVPEFTAGIFRSGDPGQST